MGLKKQKEINKDLVVYCLNNLMLSLWTVLLFIPYIILPDGFVIFTFFNVCLIYFLQNSFKVYIFSEEGLSLKYRFFKNVIINLDYDELDKITFNYVITTHSSHYVELSTKKTGGNKLAVISLKNWNEAENLIVFFKDKDVRLIINK